MGSILRLRDNLINFVSGLGTMKDPTTASQFTLNLMDKNIQETAYRSDWVARRIVDAPADDATREWRAWQASSDQIEKIEDLENKFRIQQKMRTALIKARLYGGAALVLGVEQGESWDELDLETVGLDDLKFIVPLSCHELSVGPRIYDVNSPWYGRPQYYTINTPVQNLDKSIDGSRTSLVTLPESDWLNKGNSSGWLGNVHPSRVIEFCGNDLPSWMLSQQGGNWGDSVLQTCEETLRDFGMTIGGIANMVNDAKMDVVKIPDFSKNIATQEYSDRLLKRFTFANTSKSTINSLLLDKEEEWNRIQTNFSSLPQLLQEFMVIVAGAAGIPVSRLMGQAPGKGLGGGKGGGEQDMRNYYDTIGSQQKNIYAPALEPLDEIVIRSALGTFDPHIYYEWNPLWQPDPQELAAISLQKAQVAQADVTMGLINEDVLRKIRINQLTEDATYPGIEDAVDEFGIEPPAPKPGDANWQPTVDPKTGKPAALARPSPPQSDPQPGGGGNTTLKIVHSVGDFNPSHDRIGRFAESSSQSVAKTGATGWEGSVKVSPPPSGFNANKVKAKLSGILKNANVKKIISKEAAHAALLTAHNVAKEQVLSMIERAVSGVIEGVIGVGVTLAAGPIAGGVAVAVSHAFVGAIVDDVIEKTHLTPDEVGQTLHHITHSISMHYQTWTTHDAETSTEDEQVMWVLKTATQMIDAVWQGMDAGDSSATPFRDFDPELHPREPGGSAKGGEFTSKPGAPKGVTMVSPNVENIDFTQAEKDLHSMRQQQLEQASLEIDRRLGLKSRNVAVIGAWKDGAENSLMTEYKGGDFEKQKLAAVMKAYLADQKSVLIFHDEKKGPHWLYSFEAKGDLADIHKNLLADGVAFHTMVPHITGGATVYVVDTYGDAHESVLKGASRHGSTVYAQQGRGEFVGTQKEDGSDREQRDDARNAYTGAIEGSGDSGARAVWKDVHDAYGQGLVRAERPLKGNLGHPKTISSRQVTATPAQSKGMARVESQKDDYLRVDGAAAREEHYSFAHNVGLFADPVNYPQMRAEEMKGNVEARARAVINRIKENLHFMWNYTPPEERNLWKGWYDGANKIAAGLSAKYGIDDASAAGVLAGLSPQKVWDENVYLAERVANIYTNQKDHVWDDKMEATSRQIWKKDKIPLAAAISGSRLGDLTTLTQKAMWIRTYDEAHSDRTFNLINPDGSKGELARSKDGSLSKAAWGSNPATASAIRAIDSRGDRNEISVAMGGNHKVRSFYNNILDPNSPNGDVTIDTHAVGAALLAPYTGNSTQVYNNFGTSPEISKKPAGYKASSSSNTTGINGTYAIYADAYRETAKELGIQPRQLQSVVWEHKIAMFGNTSSKKLGEISAVWQDYHDHKIELADAQRKIVGLARTSRGGGK